MRVRKVFVLLLVVALLMSVAACGSNKEESKPEEKAEETAGEAEDAENAEAAEETAEDDDTSTSEEPMNVNTENGKTLVVFFSATGTTKGVAEKIADITGADLYEIVPADPYTSEDLDWHDADSRTSIEQNDLEARPEIASEQISFDGYDTVFIGYPIWWGVAPRIMDTFVESHDFDGMTVVPFCTSGSSGIGSSGKNLEENAGGGTWLDGKRFSGSTTEDELKAWIDGLGLGL